jgi:hypothetical protein
MGEWIYTSTFSNLGRLEIIGQFLAHAALPRGKEPPLRIEWTQKPVKTTLRRENSSS